LIKRIGLLVAMLAMMAFLAAPALAQGQVERGPAHAKSICSFSGLNDFEEGPGPRTQSYGQEVKLGIFGEEGEGIEPSLVKSGPPSPGTFCNPQKAPPEFVGPFPEPVEE
jgi:hypothetical protein